MFSRTDIPRKESEEVGEHILTKAVKAGRRTYFFDVRATRGNDYYLTITESRKTTVADGSVVFDRHKIFSLQGRFRPFRQNVAGGAGFYRCVSKGGRSLRKAENGRSRFGMKKCRIVKYDIFLCGGSERPVRRDMNTLIRDFTSESGFRLSGGIAGRCRCPARRTPFERDSRRFAVVGEGRSGRRAS